MYDPNIEHAALGGICAAGDFLTIDARHRAATDDRATDHYHPATVGH